MPSTLAQATGRQDSILVSAVNTDLNEPVTVVEVNVYTISDLTIIDIDGTGPVQILRNGKSVVEEI
jgi:hypothetical protein